MILVPGVLSTLTLCAVIAAQTCSLDGEGCDYNAAVQGLARVLGARLQDLAVLELGHATVAPRPGRPHSPRRIHERLARKLKAGALLLARKPSSSHHTYLTPCPYGSIQQFLPLESFNWYQNVSALADEEIRDTLRDMKIKRMYFLSDADHATDTDCGDSINSDLHRVYHHATRPYPKLVVFIIDKLMEYNSLKAITGIVKETIHLLQKTDLIALKISEFLKFEPSCGNDYTMIANATDYNKAMLLDHIISMLEFEHRNNSLPILTDEFINLFGYSDLPKQKLIIFLTDDKEKLSEPWALVEKLQNNNNTVMSVVSVSEQDYTLSTSNKTSEHLQNVGRTAVALLSLLPSAATSLRALSPLWDATARDYVVSLVRTTSGGLLGLDLYWSDLAEDVLYDSNVDSSSRVFVIDFDGRVIMHTNFPHPDLTAEKIEFPFLSEVERYSFIDELLVQMISLESAETVKFDAKINKTIHYSWQQAVTYIVCKAGAEPSMATITDEEGPAPTRDLLYHRLDLFPPRTTCRHYRQLSTLDQPTLYLSPSSFISPFSYLHEPSDGPEGTALQRNYLAYAMRVARGLLSNPGLREGARADVARLGALAGLLRRPLRSYVVRRLAATAAGALLAYPGGPLPRDYEPARRDWFLRARRTGRLVVSPPALDPAGAGYTVTLSRGADVVLALEVPVGLLPRLLSEALPLCAAPRHRCMVVDARGRLVAHPALLDPHAAGPLDQLHLMHKEPMIAIDMLNHEWLVRKHECKDLHSGILQRYFEVNTSAVASGSEHCVQWAAAPVPGLDALVLVVRARCGGAVFCPCNTAGRACLNCARAEQTECECPCECAAPRCGSPPPACPPAAAGPPARPSAPPSLPPCAAPACSAPARAACSATAGCEWCRLERDARTPLPQPYCAPMAVCFGGAVGALTPYGSGGGSWRTPPAAALGPAAGAAVTVALVAAVAGYCYRQGRRPWPEPPPPAPQEPGRERLLPAPSPYRAGAEWARAPPAASDHGYSTMTPHEESEPRESDARSEASSAPRPAPRAAPRPPAAPTATAAPVPTTIHARDLLVPVTVHRHMEAS